MKIVWSPEAADDLEAAVEYLARSGVCYQRADDTLLIVRVYHQKREPIAR